MISETGRKLSRLTLLLGLTATVMFAGCDTDRTGRNSSQQSTFLSQGQVQAGPVEGATLVAFEIKSDGTIGQTIGQTATDSEGQYNLALNPGFENYMGPVLVTATGGSYRDEGTGNTTTLSTTLRSVIPNFSGGSTDASSAPRFNVTPLTTLAARLAESATGGFTEANITAANAAVNTAFGGGFDILTTKLVDPADNSTAAIAQDEADYTAAVAGISVAAADASIDPNQYIDLLAEDIADGKLDGRGPSGNQIFADDGVVLAIARGTNSFLSSPNNLRNVQASAAFLENLANLDGNIARNTVPGVDKTAPIVTERFPSPNAGGVFRNARVFVRLNEELDGNTVNAQTVSVTNGTNNVAGAVSYDARSRTVIFTPSTALPDSALISVTLTTGLADMQGNSIASAETFAFTTGSNNSPNPADFRATVAFTPGGSSSTVSTNTAFVVNFDRALNPASVFASGIVDLRVNGNQVPFNLSYDFGAPRFSIIPVFELAANSTVSINVTGSAQSAFGDQLGSDAGTSVTTDSAGAQDQIAPTIVAVTPADASTGAASSDSVRVSFSEGMNAATVIAATQLSLGANPVATTSTYSSGSNSIVLTPVAALQAGQTYTVSVSRSAADTAGNQIAVAFSSTFEVAAPAFSISTSSLPNGIVNQTYSQSLQVVGGTAPFSFALNSGDQLPAGLTLDAQNPGVISGVPSAAGTTSFTIIVTDSSSPAATARQQISITIDAMATTPTVSFAATASTTMDEATQSFPVTLVLNTPSPITQAVSVDVIDTLSGTAAAGTDYQAFGSSTVTFPANSGDGLTVTVNVAITNDNLFEGSETIVLNLGNISGGPGAVLGGASSHVVTVTDDGPFPNVMLSATNTLNVDEGTTGTITVELTNPTINTVTVPFTVSGVAMGGADHDLVDGQFVIAAGTTSASVTFNAMSDTIDEDDMESVVITLQNPVNANASLVNPSTQDFQIVDQTPLPVVSIDDLTSIDEETAGNAVFTVSISPPMGRTNSSATVDFVVADGSTTDGFDVTLSTGTLTFLAGQLSQQIMVPILNDDRDEDDETFTVTLMNPVNVTISTTDNVGDGVIVDGDAAPEVEFSVTTQGVDEGVGSVTLTARLANGAVSGKDVTIPFTVDAASTAANPDDFDLVDGTFPVIAASSGAAGSTETSVTFNVVDDVIAEQTETVSVTLGAPTNATLLAGGETQVVSITDNEGTPSIDLAVLDSTGTPLATGAANVGEDAGSLTVRASLSTTSSSDVTFDLVVGAGSASNPDDFADVSSASTPVRAYVARNGSVNGATVAAFAPFTGLPFSVDTQANQLNLRNNEGIAITTEGDFVQAGDVMVNGSVVPSVRIVRNISNRADGGNFDEIAGDVTIVGAANTMLVQPKGLAVSTPFQRIMVADFGGFQILVFDLATTGGDVAPIGRLDLTGIAGVSGRPWDCDFDNETNTLFVAMTDGNVLVFDSVFDPAGALTATTPARSFAIGNSAKESVNCHGIQYVGGSVDRLIVSDVGAAGDNMDGQIFVVDSALTAGSAPAATSALAPSSLTIDTGANVRLGNPVDVAFDGANLYVAEKTSDAANGDLNSVLIYQDFLSLTNSGSIAPTTRIVFPENEGPESVALDAGVRTDFDLENVSLTIPAGSMEASVSFVVEDDVRNEANETILVSFANLVGATAGATSTTLTVIDDDAQPTISVATSDVTEGESVAFIVSLDAASGQTVSASFTTADGAAVSPADFASVAPMTLDFAEGQTSVRIVVATVDDALNEASEDFSGVLSGNPISNAMEGTLTATANLADNDDLPVLNLSGSTATGEGATLTYTIDLQDSMGASVMSGQAVSVDVQVVGVTGTFTGGDFTFANNPQTLTFAPGDTSMTVDVVIEADGVNEATEDFNVVLSNVSATAQLGTSTVTTTITDADTLTASIVATTAGVEGMTDIEFTVTTSPVSEQTLTYDVVVAGDGADGVEPADFSAPAQLIVAAGSTSATLDIAVPDDMINEADEGLAVTLTQTGVFEGLDAGSQTLSSTTTVADVNDLVLSVSLGTDGTEGGANVEFNASLNRVSEQTATFSITVTGNGADVAEVGADLANLPTTVTFMAGETSKTIVLEVVADAVNEATEGLQIELDAMPAVRGYAATAAVTSTATIADNNPTTVTLTEVSAGTEANDTAAVFQIELSVVSEQEMTFTFGATPSGMSPAAAGTDFDLPASQIVTMSAGSTTQTFDVLVNSDGINEANEGFTVSIAADSAFNNLTNGTTALTLASEIADNNPLTISITADAGTTPAMEDSTTNQNFSVNLSIPTEQQFTVDFSAMAPAMDAAVLGVDYQLPTSSVSFMVLMGQTSRLSPETFSTNLVTDGVNERDESYMIQLTGVSGQTNGVTVDMANDTATATIMNDDELIVTVARVGHGAEASAVAAQFSLTLNTTSSQDVEFGLTLDGVSSVDTTTVVGMPTSITTEPIAVGTDASAPGTAMIAAGGTTVMVDVAVTDDGINEAVEGLSLTAALNTTTVNMFNTSGNSIFAASAFVTDDDTATITVSVAAGPFAEGAMNDTNPVTFTVAMDIESEQAPEISYMTAETTNTATDTGNAVSDTDFTAATGSVTFMGASQSEDVIVSLIGDNDAEQNETFAFMLSGVVGTPNGVVIGMASSVEALITDDDDATVELTTTANVGEDVGSVTYTVTLSGPKSTAVTADFAIDTMTSTASDGVDSTDLSGANDVAAVYTMQNPSMGTPSVEGFASDLLGGSGVSLAPEGNEGVAVGRDGRLYVASDAGGQASIRVMENVSDRAATAAFDVLTDSIIRGAATTMVNPKGLDVDTRRELIFVADFGASKILVFKTSDSNDVAPTASIDLGARPWDIDYEPTEDRLFIAMTDGRILIYNDFVANYITATTGTGTPDADITPTVGGAAINDNLHGIVYDQASDTLVVSGVGTVGMSPTGLPGAIYVVRGAGGVVAGSLNGMVPVAFKIDSTSPGAFFDNPVDLASDGTNLYVAEKVTGFVGRYDDFFTTFAGNPGTTVDMAPNSMTAATAPESIAIDNGQRRDFVFNTLETTTVTFNPGDTTMTVTVPVVDDTRSEGTTDETLVAGLANLTGPAAAGTVVATASIADNDAQPTLTVADVTVVEGDAGATMAFIKFTLDGATAELPSVTVDTVDGTATVADNDYAALTAVTETFSEGQTFGFIAVEVNGDTVDEADESLTVNVSGVTLATYAVAPVTVTVTNDDMDVEVSIADATAVTEGSDLVFEVTISPVSGIDVMVDVATNMAGNADVADFTARPATQVTIPAGMTSVMVAITTVDDAFYELDQTVQVELSNPINAGVNATAGTAEGTINDNDPVAINIDTASSVAVTEGDTSNPSLDFTATLDVQSEVALMIEWSTNTNGSATTGVDFTTVTGGMINFAPMTSTATFSVAVLSDTINEVNQTVEVELGNVAMGFPGVSRGTTTTHIGTINDDDTTTANIALVTNGVEGGADIQFTVTLTNESEQNLVYGVTAAGSGSDVAEVADTGVVAATVAFAAPGMAGSTSQNIDVVVTDDAVNEATEGLTVTIALMGTPVNVMNGTLSANADITDNDAITLDFAGGTSFMLDEGTVTNAISIVRSGASEQTISFSFDVVVGAGTATAPDDFMVSAGTVTFAPASGTEMVTLTLVDDMLDEVDETFELNFSALATAGVTFASSGTGALSQTVTIVDNDNAPTIDLALTAATVDEGMSVDATVTLSGLSGQDVMFDIATDDGAMGVNGAGSADYSDIDAAGVTIAAGMTTATFTISATDDEVNEADQMLSATISNFVNATAGVVTQTLTINASDPLQVSIDNPTVDELSGGANANATFTVSIDRDTEQLFSLTATPTAGTAQDSTGMNQDFMETAGTVMFDGQANPGVRTASFDVAVLGDDVNEPSESFTVVLTALSLADGSTILDDTGLATVLDNDPLTVSTADVTINETDGMATFTVTFDVPSEQSILVDYSVSSAAVMAPNDPAEAADFDSAATGRLVFVPMDQSEDFSITVNDDTVNEAVEQFIASLVFVGQPDNATISTPTATATINDDDMITVDVDGGLSVAEDVGTAMVGVQITNVATGLVGATEQSFDVLVATANSATTPNATAGAGTDFPTDYNPASSTLSFGAGTSTLNLNVTIVEESMGNGVNEAVEFFDVNLSAPMALPNNVALGVTNGIVTITDNDNVTISINPPPTDAIARTPAEGNGGAFTIFNFDVVMTGRTDQQININYRITSGGTNPATAGTDFLENDNIIVFGQDPNLATRTRQAPAQILADSINETDQTFRLIVTNAAMLPARVTVAPAEAIATIFDDDDLQVQLSNVGAGVALEANGVADFQVDFVSATGVNQTEQTFSVIFQALTGVNGATVAADAGTDFDDAPQTVSVTGTPTAPVGVSTSRPITVNVVNDTINEGTENFRGRITNLQPVTVRGITVDAANSETTQTITDNDEIQLAIRPAAMSVIEDAGNFAFEVFAMNPGLGANATGSTQSYSFDFATRDGVITGGLVEATAGADYNPVTATRSIMGTSDFTMNPVIDTIMVPVTNDAINEALEGFLGGISNPMGELVMLSMTVDAEAQIADNDTINFTIAADMSPIMEGDTGDNVNAVFTITRTTAVSMTEQMFALNNLVTANTALSGQDFTPPAMLIDSFDGTAGAVDVLPGGTATLTVPVLSDEVNEFLTEDFSVALVISPVLANVTVGGPATQVITDDDLLELSLQVDNASGEESVSPRVFSLVQGPNNEATSTRQTFNLNFVTVDGTATSTAPVDFTAPMGATFAFTGTDMTPQDTANADLLLLTNSVAITDDTINEADEQFNAVISLAAMTSNVNLGVDTIMNTITDMDDPIELELVLVSMTGYSEGSGGNLPTGSDVDMFIVRNSNAAVTDTEQNFQVVFNTTDDIATSVPPAAPTPQDFLAVVNNTLSFGPGNLSQTQAIALIADTINEIDEVFSGNVTPDGGMPLPGNVSLVDAGGMTQASLSIDATINDNDDFVLRVDPGIPPTQMEGETGNMNVLNFVINSGTPGISVTEQDFFVSFATLASTSTPMASVGGDYTQVDPTTAMAAMPPVAVPTEGFFKVPTGVAISITAPVAITADEVNEPDEFVAAQVTAVTAGGGPIPGVRGVTFDMTAIDGTIIDDDPIALVYNAASTTSSAMETDAGTQAITLTVDLVTNDLGMPAVPATSQEDITSALVDNVVAGMDSLEATDYVDPTSVTVTAGMNSAMFDFVFNSDDINEANEVLDIMLGAITTASARVTVGAADTSRFTGNDDDVLVLQFAAQNNLVLFERGNGGSQTRDYVTTVDGAGTMAMTTEQTFRVVASFGGAAAPEATAGTDFTVGTFGPIGGANGGMIGAGQFSLGSFLGTAGAPITINNTNLDAAFTLTVNDEGGTDANSGNEADEAYRFSNVIDDTMGGTVDNVSISDGTTIDGTVTDIALLNLNGAMTLASNARTITVGAAQTDADLQDTGAGILPVVAHNSGTRFDRTTNAGDLLLVAITGAAVGDVISFDGGSPQVTFDQIGGTSGPTLFHIRSVSEGAIIGSADFANATAAGAGTASVVLNFTQDGNGNATAINPSQADMQVIVNRIRVSRAAPDGARNVTLNVTLQESDIPSTDDGNEVRTVTISFN